jgi:ankyrin repeat protein
MEETPALIAAAANNQLEVLQLLLAAGADVTAKTQPTQGTALKWAAERGYRDAVRFLLETNADPASQLGDMALAAAAGAGNEAIVRLLLDKGVSPDPVGPLGNYNPPILGAACRGHVGTLRMLLDKGGNVNTTARGLPGQSALSCSLNVRSFDVLRLLVERGADVKKVDKDLQAGLLGAIVDRTDVEDQPGVVKLLLDHGANVNAKNLGGTSVLQLAMGRLGSDMPNPNRSANLTAVIKILIERGADVNVRDGFGTLLYRAQKYPEIVEILRAAGAKP